MTDGGRDHAAALPWYAAGGVLAAVAVAGLLAAIVSLVTTVETGEPFAFACVLMGLVLAAGCGYLATNCFGHAKDAAAPPAKSAAERSAFLDKLKGDR